MQSVLRLSPMKARVRFAAAWECGNGCPVGKTWVIMWLWPGNSNPGGLAENVVVVSLAVDYPGYLAGGASRLTCKSEPTAAKAHLLTCHPLPRRD